MTGMTEGRRRGRPATGQSPMQSFRLPESLKTALHDKAKTEGRPVTDVLVGLVHRYVSTPPKAPPSPAEPDGP
jgi:hypothetical protein